MNFLGHVVAGEGVETDPGKLEKVRNWPVPRNPEELLPYLAFCGYNRKFDNDFCLITRHLAELIQSTSPKNQNKRKEWQWTEEHQKIFII